jgi:LysM repeat protein
MKRSRGILLGILALVVICLVLALLGYLVYSLQRRQAMEGRPLVLIHTPFNREQIPLGDGVLAHVSARAQGGVARVELWADGVLVAAQDAPAEGPVPLLALSAGWQPQTLGPHTLVVRAVSAAGVEGQATVVIESVEAAAQEAPAVGAHIAQEGETLESIAAEVGASVEEVAALNPDVGPEGPQPGDVLYYPPEEDTDEEGGSEPVDEEAPSGEEAPSDGETPPDPQAEAPWSGGLELLWFAELYRPPVEPVLLRVEALALETGAAYESLHCYVAVGEGDPRWYPDDDGDPATDESFGTLNGEVWNVAAHLSGDYAPVFPWPGDQPLPVTITCVGLHAGGTDAVEVGRLEIVARPETWDGLIRHAVSAGGEDSFALEYRIGLEEEHAKYPDPSITSPTNVRIDEPRSSLRWDYEAEDELPIDGFCVYLNDVLQWSEPADSRESRLPEEWFRPPCGEEYRFTVAAFRGSCLPEDPQSPPSNAATTFTGEIGDPGCQRAVLVTFETLTTGDLGGDGRRDVGDMGPVYGAFYANDQQISFDGRAGELGWNHNSRYDIDNLASSWGSGTAQLLVELPPGDPYTEELLLWMWFDIDDADTGRCRDSDDPGCPDDVCSGETALYESRLATRYSGTIGTDRPIDALPDRCRVSYTVQPVGEVPVVAPGEPPPLPDLRVENMTVDESTNRPRIHVRNVGGATWQAHDLEVAVSSRAGVELGILTWPALTLTPGEVAILQHADLAPDPPLSVCVLLDPNNAVEEESDRLARDEIWTRGAYCQSLPDLTITNVEYDADTATLLMTVQNAIGLSGGSLEHRDVSLHIDLADGSTLSDRPVWRSNVSLVRQESVVLEWPISAEQRARMMDGYTVVVDALDSIVESDEENNTYTVPASARLRVAWPCGWVSFCESGRYVEGGANTWQMHLRVSVSGGRSSRTIAEWDSPEVETSWRNENESWCNSAATYATDWFGVAGDESLNVYRWADLDIVGHGYRWFDGGMDALQAEDDFEGASLIPLDTPQECLFEISCPLTWGGRGGTTCVPLTCGNIGPEGQHDSGTIYASGDRIAGICFWNTTYVIYQAEE